jgi:hypothetical protein
MHATHELSRTILLFQFHTHFELCRSRIALMRRLSPEMEIFGLYGGASATLDDARSLETTGLTYVYHDCDKTQEWNKWKNTDLAVARWYCNVGRSIPFDRVHIVQWDLLFFAPLDRVYRNIPEGAVALSGLIPLKRIAHFWEWVVDPALSADSERLFTIARERFGYAGEPYACIGPGYSLSRGFLEAFSALDVEAVGHDELRLPLFAQILGFELADTGFYPRWKDPEIERFFNAGPWGDEGTPSPFGSEIDPALVASELAHEAGWRVFHPCRGRFDAAVIEELLKARHAPATSDVASQSCMKSVD